MSLGEYGPREAPARAGDFVTLRVRPAPGSPNRKHFYVSGLLVRADRRHVTLTVEHFDAWRNTTTHTTHAIERHRITRASVPLPRDTDQEATP